jgi:uncharacterized Ntn-hydrolase superfamily protein
MTYSIVARDPSTGELGVAVQSHWFAAGSVVPWAEAGVGAVATQASVEVAYGPRALDLLRAGATAAEAMEELVARDSDRDVRQVAIVDAAGNVANHTGARTIPEAGHSDGDGFSCQANMMWDDTVWDAMARAYTGTDGDLPMRLLAALDAAQEERGDVRGQQAAGILIVEADKLDEPWRGVRMHLHTDDHDDPLGDLRRLVEVHQAYEHLQRSEDLALEGDKEGARRETEAALSMAPDNDEVRFWTALGMAQAGYIDEAKGLIGQVYANYPGWEELLRRLAAHKLIDLAPDTVDDLLP